MEGDNDLSKTFNSFNISDIDISGIEKPDEKKQNLMNSLHEISKAFENIKNLRKNFVLEDYDKYIKRIGQHLKVLRKLYDPKNKDKKQTDIKNSQNKFQINSNQQFSSTNQSDINAKMQSNSGNNTNINLNSNSRGVVNYLNDTTFIDFKIENKNNDINNQKNIMEIHNILMEIVSFILCYDDIYINYETKSAYYSLQLLLRIPTLRFLKDIKKANFILMIINKICNILYKYNQLNKNDKSIKKYLIYNKQELKDIEFLFQYNSEFINKIRKKLENEINKFSLDLLNKVEKINEEKMIKDISTSNEEKEKKLKIENDINNQFNKLNLENEILDNIQKELDENHKMFLKEPLKKELEIFNILINKLSEYKTPIIKKKFLDIIIRNKEVFKYINENIFLENIPNLIIKKYNLYPFNKNLSVFIDKYITTGKLILDVLEIPLEVDYLEITKDLEIFTKEFLDKLFSYCDIKKPNYEINYYDIALFAYMLNSNLSSKDLYFNRISALISSDIDTKKICDILDDSEKITLYDGQNDNIILFDFLNMNKNNENNITFLLEKKINDDNDENNNKMQYNKNKKRKKKFSNLEICSILSKKLFNKDSLYIILFIALKYWGIQRKIFKDDYSKRENEEIIFDDKTLLYFLYYFLIHKGKMDCIDNILEEKEEKKDIIKREDEDRKNNLSSLLKTLGELFIEFFWFVHEIIKLALNENKNNSENKDRKIVCISLSNKNYSLNNLFGVNRDNENILRLDFFDNIIYELGERNANKLKRETTRALYFLLSESKEIFAFDQFIPIKN